MNHLIGPKPTAALFFTVLALLCLAFLPNTHAVFPPPDGGYPNGNTAEGQAALLSLTTGGFNTAIGYLSLRSDTTAGFNTAIGAGALLANTADRNTATGAGALLSNTTAVDNTANGAFALLNNNTGHGNTAVGAGALFMSTTSDSNTAVGVEALHATSSGEANTAVGAGALFNNTTGNGNAALGIGAGLNVTTANNVISIRHLGANVNNSTWIANIYGVTTQSGTTAPVVVSDGGQLGTVASSERFKKDIVTMEKASEMILALRPVTFHYKSDAKETPQFGLIAEEVANVNPNLVVRDKEGKPYTVRYDAVNTMLLNEFLKEHRTVLELKKEIAVLAATVKEQAAQIQKVNAQIETRKAVPRMARNY